MSESVQHDVIELVRAFLSHHPTMRLGQAVCGITGWDVEEPSQASDEVLIELLRRHLEGNFGDEAYVSVNSSISEELATALRGIRQLLPSAPLGKLLTDLVCKNNWNLYDVENEDLVVAIRDEVSNALRKPTRGRPVSA